LFYHHFVCLRFSAPDSKQSPNGLLDFYSTDWCLYLCSFVVSVTTRERWWGCSRAKYLSWSR